MVNLKERHQTPEPIGICYFVGRHQVGDEVRFPRPPVVTEPVTKKHASPPRKPLTIELPSEPKEEYKGYAYYEAERQKKRASLRQIFALLVWALFILVVPMSGLEHLLVWFGPKPSPAIIPAPPYWQHQEIKGPSVNGVVHTWIYYKGVGWVDP